MNKNIKFLKFLNTVKQHNPSLVESIVEAFAILHENTEEKVEQIDEKLSPVQEPTPETPLDELAEPGAENEFKIPELQKSK
jgi:hypothetical protein